MPTPDEERRQAVVIVLAPFLERMMMALGALHAHAQEQLRGRLRPVGGLSADQVEVGRAVGEGAALGGDDVAHHLVDRLVVAERPRTQLWKLHMPLFLEQVAVDAQQIAPFERPEIDELRPVQHVVDRLACACRAALSARNALISAGVGKVPMASRWMRRKNSSSLHSGDGVRPRSFHLAISLSSMKLSSRRVGIAVEWPYGSVTCTTVAWPPKRIMMCVSPRPLAVTRPSGVTAATASLSASNWAVRSRLRFGRRSRWPARTICCCSPGTITPLGRPDFQRRHRSGPCWPARGRRPPASCLRISYSRELRLEALAAAVLHDQRRLEQQDAALRIGHDDAPALGALDDLGVIEGGIEAEQAELEAAAAERRAVAGPLVAAGLGQHRHDFPTEAHRIVSIPCSGVMMSLNRMAGIQLETAQRLQSDLGGELRRPRQRHEIAL